MAKLLVKPHLIHLPQILPKCILYSCKTTRIKIQVSPWMEDHIYPQQNFLLSLSLPVWNEVLIAKRHLVFFAGNESYLDFSISWRNNME